jgi:HSP20 family molecular chaperone IbpA
MNPNPLRTVASPAPPAQLDRLFEPYAAASDDQSSAATCDWIPPVDIKEEKDRYVLRADIPGVDPKEIEIIAENGILTLRGNRSGETRDNRAGYSRVERPCGTFLSSLQPAGHRRSGENYRPQRARRTGNRHSQADPHLSRTIKVEG